MNVTRLVVLVVHLFETTDVLALHLFMHLLPHDKTSV